MDDLREPAVGTDRDLHRLAKLVGTCERLVDGGGDLRAAITPSPPRGRLLARVALMLQADPLAMPDQAAVVGGLDGR